MLLWKTNTFRFGAVPVAEKASAMDASMKWILPNISAARDELAFRRKLISILGLAITHKRDYVGADGSSLPEGAGRIY